MVVQLVRVGFGRVRGPDGYVLSVYLRGRCAVFVDPPCAGVRNPSATVLVAPRSKLNPSALLGLGNLVAPVNLAVAGTAHHHEVGLYDRSGVRSLRLHDEVLWLALRRLVAENLYTVGVVANRLCDSDGFNFFIRGEKGDNKKGGRYLSREVVQEVVGVGGYFTC